MAADLHMHTKASDGKDSIYDRARQAQEQDLDTIAITDHDAINDDLEDRKQVIDGVEVITGAEIKCEVDGTGIEVLGYFLDPEDSEIHSLLDSTRQNRQDRMERMIDNINHGEDFDLTLEEVESYAEGTVGRPHLGEALVDRDIVETVNEAFNQYIGDSTDYYVETEKPDSGEVIETIHQNGGAASLAHPGRDLPYEDAESIVGKLVNQGLDGIEVDYTYQHKRQDGYGINFGIREAHELAQEYDDLVITGGSDCHGEDSGKYNIGMIRLDPENVEELEEIAESYR